MWIFAGALASAGILVLVKDVLASYEEPDYKILLKRGSLELREYPPLLAAEVAVGGNGDAQANKAFSILAGYIFGKNKTRSKIAMTTPVTQQTSAQKIAMTIPVTRQDSNEELTMRFYMPSEFTLETLPEAEDKRIRFVQLPKKQLAVVRFSGSASDSNFEQHVAELQAFVKDIGMTACGDSCRAYYNPPWTLPIFKRNEIWIPVE
jgi:effector-binding domain-containing protein